MKSKLSGLTNFSPDGSCFLVAWAISKSASVLTYDKPKPKLPKRKGIYQFRCSASVF